MKKRVAILLAIAATLLCLCACAEQTANRLHENSDALEFFLAVPNGMALEQTAYDPGVVGSIEVAGMPELSIMFSLMPDDSYAGLDMSELTAQEAERLAASVTEDLGQSASELYDMPCGLKAMVIRDVANTEYITMTLKDGYFFYMIGFHTDFSPLTDEEAAAVKSAFDSLSVESKTAE